jgi:hypothetical protein
MAVLIEMAFLLKTRSSIISRWLVYFSLGVSSLLNASSLFENDAVIDVELIGQVQSLIDNRQKADELPFILRADGVDHPVTVRVRGKSRLSVCHFPPYRLNFGKDNRAQTVFAGQEKLKLVTHCRNTDSGEINALEEYAAYRIFALLSDAAYRVRLLHITYTDTGQGMDEDARHRYGFIIEPTARLAERIGGVSVDIPGVALGQLNPDQAALVYVFQYLIGNTDWSFVLADLDDECCHNGQLIEIEEELYYVPYDFDLAGIVNAKYAKPDPSLRLRNVRKRKYRGFCTESETLANAIRKVNSRKPEIYRLVREIPGLMEKDLENAETYLAQFFEKANDEEKLLRSFEKQCID